MKLYRTVNVVMSGLFLGLGIVSSPHVYAEAAEAREAKIQVDFLSQEALSAIEGGMSCDNVETDGGPKDDCNAKSKTNDPVDVRNGNLFYDFVDFPYPTRGGGQIALSRHYNAQSFSELANWEADARSGTWVIQNGVYSGQGDRTYSKNSYTDTIIELDMRTVDPGANPWETGWINFRYTDKQNRYYLLFHAAGGTVTAELSKIVGGATTTLATNGAGFVDALAWNRVRIENVGNSIKIFINGAPFCNLTDTSFTSGQVALESVMSHSHFDNVVITDLVTPANSTSDDFDVVDNDNLFGNQWTNNYTDRLWERSNGDVVVERGRGTRQVFVNNGSGYDPPPDVNDTLVKNTGVNYTLTTKYGLVTTFGTDGTLSSTADRNNNTTTFGYTNVNATISPFVKIDRLLTVDNFENSLINWNALNRWTDDDGTLSSESLVSGAIQLGWNNTSDYWYTTMYQGTVRADLSGYTHLTADLKGLSGGEDFKVMLQTDGGNAMVQLSTYAALTTTQQTVQIPLSAFTGVDLTKAKAIALIFNVQASGTIQMDNLGFVANTAANPQVNYTAKRLTSITDSSGRVTTLAYGSNGKVSQVTNPANRVFTYAYDSDGNQITATDPRGFSQTFAYNPNRTLNSYTDRNGNAFQIEYAYNNRCVKVTDPLGKITTLTYLWSFTEIRNNDGDKWTYQVDPPTDKLLAVTDPLGGVQSWELDPNCGCGQAMTVIDQNGNAFANTYDQNRNVLTTTDSLNQTITRTYDPVYNLVLSTTDKLGQTINYTYDANGNMDSMVDVLLHVTSYTYDASGNRLTETNPLGHQTTYVYDSHGNLLTQSDPLGSTWTYTYNPVGQRLSQIDPKSNTTTYVYDDSGFNTSILDPLGNVTTTVYDGNGNPTSITRPGSRITTLAYDGVGNLITETDPLGYQTIHVYNTKNFTHNGQSFQIQSTNANSHVTMTAYDVLGRVTSVTDPNGGVTSQTYDMAGRLLTTTDPNGNTTSYDYTVLNQRRETIFPDGKSHVVAYDQVGNWLSETNRGGYEVIYQHDALSRLTKVIHEDGKETQTSYDAVGNIQTRTDELGRVTAFLYDASNQLIQATLPDPDDVGIQTSPVITHVYDANGHIQSTTETIDDSGSTRTTTYVFDALNRPTQTIMPDPDAGGPLASPTRSSQYDGVGNVISTMDEMGYVTQYEYDLADRLIKVTHPDPDGSGPQAKPVSEFGYDALGNQTLAKDPLLRQTLHTYNALNQLIQTQDPEAGVTSYGYDLNGNLLSVTDPVGNQTTYEYDSLNQRIREIDPRNKVTLYGYDSLGNRISKVDRNGRETQWVYDSRSRLIQEQWINSPVYYVVVCRYDDVGNLTEVVDGTRRLTFTYDQLNRVMVADNNNGGDDIYTPQVQLDDTYDHQGNRLSVADSLGATQTSSATTTAHQYDALGRLTRLTQTSGPGGSAVDKRVDLAYNALSQLTLVDRYSQLSGGSSALIATTAYVFDGMNRLTTMTHQDGSSVQLNQYAFTHDVASQIAQISDTDTATAYTYDDNARLTTADRTDPVNPDESYGYDANGNRISSHLHNTTYQTGPANVVTTAGQYTYTYDDEGNLIQRTDTSTGSIRQFTYNYRNRLTRVEDRDSVTGPITQEVQYVYDAFNRRITKIIDANGATARGVVWTHFVYDREDVILDFIDPDGFGPSGATLSNRYLHGPGVDTILAQENVTNGSVLWLLTDHLGATKDIVDHSGTLVNHIKYDSFGNIVNQTSTTATTRYTYTGREWEPEVDLYYYRARLYDPQIGKFTQRDPIGFGDGVNLYEYVDSNPILFTDPTGLESFNFVARSWINPTAIATRISFIRGKTHFQIASLTALAVASAALDDQGATDEQDGRFRMYTRLNIDFTCEKDECENSDKIKDASYSRDSDTGREAGIKVGGRFDQFQFNEADDAVQFSYRFRARPLAIAEVGIQRIQPRTSTDIWHRVEGKISCEDGAGKYTVNITGSRFPQHSLFANGKLETTIGGRFLDDLWTASGGDPVLVAP